jgi:hypothetical protein
MNFLNTIINYKVPFTPSCKGISKRRLLETLCIPDNTFELASKLYIEMQFDYWNYYTNLVLLVYKK